MEGTIVEAVGAPTIRIVGPQLYDDVIVRAAWKASERIWRELGVLVLVEYENTGVLDYLSGVGLPEYDPKIILQDASGESFEIRLNSIDSVKEDMLVEMIQREVIRRLAKSDLVIEVAAPTIRGEGEGLHGLAGA